MKKTEVKVAGKALYLSEDEQTCKVGCKGKPMPVGAFIAELLKGEARRCRKMFHAAGHRRAAAARRGV